MEARLFDPAAPPEWTTPEWYADRPVAPHLEQQGHHDRLVSAAHMVWYTTGSDPSECTVSDLGAGDGGLLALVAADPGVGASWGYDLQPSNVAAAAARGVRVELLDVVADFDGVEFGRTVVATEFLEHLLDPHGFLRRLHAETPVKWLVASSPFRETVEEHYEYHCWAWDVAGYEAMLAECGWHVRCADFPWICQVVLAERLP
jgi:hypothetical protein